MSRPLLASKPMVDRKKNARRSAASRWHDAVFRAHGSRCFFCGGFATDAMHIVPRGQLGPIRRYACAEENGRPGCRACHDLQEQHQLRFPIALRRMAVAALNAIPNCPPLKEPV